LLNKGLIPVDVNALKVTIKCFRRRSFVSQMGLLTQLGQYRLFNCLNAIFPELEPRYTANLGLDYAKLQFDMVPLDIEKALLLEEHQTS